MIARTIVRQQELTQWHWLGYAGLLPLEEQREYESTRPPPEHHFVNPKAQGQP